MTLVFAKDASLEAIREALFARRTAAYSGNLLVGKEEFLRPIFEASIEILSPAIQVRPGGGPACRSATTPTCASS